MGFNYTQHDELYLKDDPATNPIYGTYTFPGSLEVYNNTTGDDQFYQLAPGINAPPGGGTYTMQQLVAIALGTRVGVSWLGGTDGTCRYCREGRENLCDAPVFTGYDVDGGFATEAVVRADFAHPLSDRLDDLHAAPKPAAS